MKPLSIASLSLTLILASAPSASADLVLSLDKVSYTIDGAGETTAVQVFVSQTSDGPQVGVGNELLTAGVELTFATAGAATVVADADVAPGSAWDSGSVLISTDGSNTLVDLGLTSLLGISDLSTPLLLGTFLFTGQSPGDADVSVAALAPGPSFITAGGDELDPTNAARAVITVSATPPPVVPEPGSVVLASLGGLISAVGLAARRRRT
jgi:hypothetical protein